MADRIQLRRDTAANWTAYNPILLEGEPGIELDTDQWKMGDGIHNWNDLPYRGGPYVQQKGQSTTVAMSQKAVTDELNKLKPGTINIIPNEYANVSEVYLTGIDATKIYEFKRLGIYVQGSFKATQAILYEVTYNSAGQVTAQTMVAGYEVQNQNGYCGIVVLSEKNDSGISGYALVNIADSSTTTNNLNNRIVNENVIDLNNSPRIYDYLHTDSIPTKGSKNYIESNAVAILNERLRLFKSVSSDKVYDRCLMLALKGLNDGSEYRIKFLKHSVYSGTYHYADIQIADSEDNVISIGQVETSEDYYGFVNINKWSGYSGTENVTGVALLNIKATDTDNVTAVIDNKKVIANYKAICVYADSEPKENSTDFVLSGGVQKNQDKPFAIGLEIYKHRIVECYLEGLDPTKQYKFELVRYFVYNDYKVVQIHIHEYNGSSHAAVAGAEYATTEDFLGIVKINQMNGSGISGYALLNIKVSDTNNPSPLSLVNIEKCSNVYNSPFIYKHLHPEESVTQQQFLWTTPFKSVSSSKVYDRCLGLILSGLDSSKEYYCTIRHAVYATTYHYAEIQVKYDDDGTAVIVAMAQIDSINDFYGVAEIRKYSGYSGPENIQGFALLNIKATDTDTVTAYLNNEKLAFARKIVPEKAEYAEQTSVVKKNNVIWYGNYRNDGFGGFSGVTIETVVAFEDTTFPNEGVLSKLKFKAKGSSMKFGLGIIDQRNLPVIRTTFTVDCTPDVLVEKDVLNLGLKVYEGETLFCMFSSNDTSICFTTNTESSQDVQMIYGGLTYPMHRLASTYGGRHNLYFETCDIDSPFALKENLAAVDTKADKATELATQALSNFGLVKDRQGNYYQMVVVNGALTIVPLQYKKVLVICNSIGVNGRVYSLGWCAIRGMSASRDGLDYRTHLENGLKQKYSNAEVVLRNVWNWEQNFDSITPAQLMDGYLTNDLDCIIFRAGENIPNDRADIAENVVALMNYCISQCPNANIFVTSMVWEKASHNQALLEAATELGVPFIDVTATTAEYRERSGDYLEGDYTEDGGQTWDTTRTAMYKISGGAASHANDIAMLKIANNILTVLKYTPLDLLRNITIGNTNGKTCSLITDKWVAGGIVNVMSNGSTVSVVDSDSTSITVTDHEDGVFTFVMPNKDVTISVS